MMRKYFPLEASERLFVAIEEDDVVDAQVSLPPTIALSCTTENRATQQRIPPCTVGKTGATDPDPGDDFAGCAVYL
ncbi:hypothetical protein K4A55_004121 [Escherichia coli]|nr:hypothetical protein [Escherichia coli]EHY2528116.1 hypothetical protein [Escherichia coli]MBC0465668.1 hypothetical protein [Escherichia coli]